MKFRKAKPRLFLGAHVSLDTVNALAETAESMRKAAYDAGYQVRWIPPESYHITLKFLGATEPEVANAIRDRLAAALAPISPFEITTRGVGAFPNAHNARVLWAGIEDRDGGLSRIAAIVEDELDNLGFPREKRPFHPHVTLGRVKRVDDLSQLLQPGSERVFRKSVITSVTLFESVMNSSGSEYIEQHSFLLGTPLHEPKRHTGPLQEPQDYEFEVGSDEADGLG